MMTTGFSLAVLTSTGFYMIYRKLPLSIRQFMQKHVLLTDMVACMLTYMLFGGTLTALFAAAFTGILVSLLLALAQDERTRQALEGLADKVVTIKEKFINGLAALCAKQETPKAA